MRVCRAVMHEKSSSPLHRVGEKATLATLGKTVRRLLVSEGGRAEELIWARLSRRVLTRSLRGMTIV